MGPFHHNVRSDDLCLDLNIPWYWSSKGLLCPQEVGALLEDLKAQTSADIVAEVRNMEKGKIDEISEFGLV